MRIRNVLRVVAVGCAWIGLILFGYIVAGLVGGAIPTNRDWRGGERQAGPRTEQGVRIYVESNGIHVGIVVPKVAAGPGWRVDWRPLLPARHLRDPRYAAFDHASFGWGEAKFYLETPTWWDLSPATVAAAALGSARTLVHVDHVPAPQPGRDVRTLVLTPGQYQRLARYIRASMAARAAVQPGYWVNDVFYTGTGRYSAVRTCNAWAGDVLRYAGVRVGAWTPFPVTVLWWF